MGSPKAPSLREFAGTSEYFAALEKDRQRRRLTSSDFRFTRRVGRLQELEARQKARLKRVNELLARPIDNSV